MYFATYCGWLSSKIGDGGTEQAGGELHCGSAGKCSAHQSLFVGSYSAVSQISPRRIKTKNVSLVRFSKEEHQNWWTARTGLRAIPHDGEDLEGWRGAAFVTMLLKIKEKNTKTLVKLFSEGAVITPSILNLVT